MSTKDEFDYEQWSKDNPPVTAQLRNSVDARAQRRRAAKTRITIRIDEDTVQQFRELAADEGGSYQTLINVALREWLTAQDVTALLRSELPAMLREAVTASTKEKVKTARHG
jgi:uncharacterized protein (DUF4415 family)